MQSVYSNTQYSEFHLSVFVCTYVKKNPYDPLFVYLFFVNYITILGIFFYSVEKSDKFCARNIKRNCTCHEKYGKHNCKV